jgi:hypothetical protein
MYSNLILPFSLSLSATSKKIDPFRGVYAAHEHLSRDLTAHRGADQRSSWPEERDGLSAKILCHCLLENITVLEHGMMSVSNPQSN